ncbi:hypothetical protein [Streptomyces fulvoviolaceus]|uniref:hypothetical protein n=1 Tax=Streptomyces fulvoviolaceus TaxID=285535 RepID=UPI0004C7E174|nr:hypothetical protein [Streptomyces fulvoviolaceus]MCT9078203.1 hypothetical protein [Streptomyces fulvoviolaceus]
MTDHSDEGPGESGAPVPRDMPDQQAHDGEDPWEIGAGRAQGDTVDTTEAAEAAESAADVPDSDEEPDEPSD